MKGLIHIGANDALEYKGTDRLTVLFEPLKAPFNRINTIHGNNPKVTAYNYALGSINETRTMNVADNNEASSSLLHPIKHLDILPNIHFIGTEKVQVRTLDSVISAPELFDEMTIDVQGYEIHVLTGAMHTLKYINRINIEVNRDEVYENCTKVGDLDLFLGKFGFKRTSTDWHGGIWGDAVYEKML